MSDNYLAVYFAYRDGDADKLKKEHMEAFQSSGEFDVNSPFIETEIGNVECHSTEVPAVTGMSFIYKFAYEGNTE